LRIGGAFFSGTSTITISAATTSAGTDARIHRAARTTSHPYEDRSLRLSDNRLN
jgi:hypothetical protein